MKAAATKQEPATSIEDQITELHEAIDKLVAVHVDGIKAAYPTIPRGVLEDLAIARAPGGSGCRCSIYRHLFVPKKP